MTFPDKLAHTSDLSRRFRARQSNTAQQAAGNATRLRVKVLYKEASTNTSTPTVSITAAEFPCEKQNGQFQISQRGLVVVIDFVRVCQDSDGKILQGRISFLPAPNGKTFTPTPFMSVTPMFGTPSPNMTKEPILLRVGYNGQRRDVNLALKGRIEADLYFGPESRIFRPGNYLFDVSARLYTDGKDIDITHAAERPNSDSDPSLLFHFYAPDLLVGQRYEQVFHSGIGGYRNVPTMLIQVNGSYCERTDTSQFEIEQELPLIIRFRLVCRNRPEEIVQGSVRFIPDMPIGQ